jgi:hypothetical protein
MISKSPPVWRPYISNGPVAERLDEFPDALRDTTVYPWEETDPPICWQWGADKNRPLRDIASRELIRKQDWLRKKQGTGTYFSEMLQAIEEILQEREGL